MLHHAYENVKLFSQPEFLRPFKIMAVIFLSSYLLGLRPAKFYILNTLRDLGVQMQTDQTKIMVGNGIFYCLLSTEVPAMYILVGYSGKGG